MKKILLRLFLFIIMFFGIVPATSFNSDADIHKVDAASYTYTYIGLDAGGSGLWDQGGAWFSAYFFKGSSSKFVTLTKDSSGIYCGQIPSNINPEYVIFVRNNPADNTADWTNVWNQTADLELGSAGNIYKITYWSGGEWKYADSGYSRSTTVKFNSNLTGVSNPSSNNVAFGFNYGNAPSISATGYTFVEWNSKVDGTGSTYSANTTVSNTVSNTVNYYAKWTENTYNITFNANGGSGSTSGHSNIKYTSNVTLNANGFSKNGFDFAGWNTNANASSAQYANNDTVNKLIGNGTITLYAMWSKTITFYADLSSVANNIGDNTIGMVFIDFYNSMNSTSSIKYVQLQLSNELPHLYKATVTFNNADIKNIKAYEFAYEQVGDNDPYKKTKKASFSVSDSTFNQYAFHVPSSGPTFEDTGNNVWRINNISIEKATHVTYHLEDGSTQYSLYSKREFIPHFYELEGYRLLGWCYDQNKTNQVEKNADTHEMDYNIDLYPNYEEANDYYIYVDTLDKPWNSFSVYMWSNTFSDPNGGTLENGAFPGVNDPEIVTDIGNKMYKIKIDTSKSYDHLIFANTANVGDENNPKQTIDLELTPDKNYYVFTTEIVQNQNNTPCYHVRYEEETDNFLHAQKNISSDANEFRFIAGFKNKTEANAFGGAEADLSTKQFGYKFIFVKGNTSYVGYWNFNKDYKYNVIRYEGTLYESVDSTGKTGDDFTAIENEYSEFYALSLTDDVTFKYSDYEQIIVVACYRDANNKVQVIRAQEYNIVTNSGTIYLNEIER